MATKKFDVVVATGRKYTDANGQERSSYMNIGVIMETDKGFRLKLESVPVGWDGWAYLSEPRQKQQPTQQQPKSLKPRSDFSDMEDDIPF